MMTSMEKLSRDPVYFQTLPSKGDVDQEANGPDS